MRVLYLFLALLLTAPLLEAQRAPDGDRPRLLVLLMVDQMRADYLDTYRHQWSHGLARLVDQGAVFTNARYPYASTTTCSGHASVASGTPPAVHGMIMNTWWDRERSRLVACADDPMALALSYGSTVPAEGQSGWRLDVPTLADELRHRLERRPQVGAFSLKARSAVTLAGQRPDVAAWTSDAGAWVTSTAYGHGLAPDVAAFIAAHPVEHELWSEWQRTLPLQSYLFPEQAIGARVDDTPAFPHALRTWTDWEASPLSDEYLAGMALHVARSRNFGRGEGTDYLAISFSALDLVGHAYGPNSHEVQDVLIRLDRTLGHLLDGLDALVGRDRYAVALTADHGVSATPEWSTAQGHRAGRIPSRTISEAAERAISQRLGPGRWVTRLVNGELYLTPGTYDALSAAPEGLTYLVAALERVPGVQAVFTASDLESGAFGRDPHLGSLVAASHRRDRSGDLSLVFEPHWLVGTADGTNHGSGHDYDTRVPLILAGSGIVRGRYATAVTPLDIAPTLGALTGIDLPHAHGRALREALSHSAGGPLH